MSVYENLMTSSEEILQNMITNFENYTGETLNIGNEKRQMLQGFSYVLAVVLNNIEETAKQNLLKYSIGEALASLGELMGVERLEAEPSTVTLQFSLIVQPFDVTIPKGTRATADGTVFFATDEDLIIESGEDYGTVTATATVSGAIGNGFVAGQIVNIVDGVPYVSGVTNTTTSTNGRDIETDEDMKERMRLAPFSFSTAGAEEAYKYLALSANANVGDVQAYRTEAGCVTVAVVKTDGTLPDADGKIINDVINACSAKDKRPLTDFLTVEPAKTIDSSIDVTYYISKENNTKNAEIQVAVAEAVETYKLWQTTKIGRNINPDKLRALMLNAGAEKITITTPTEATVADGEVAQFKNVNVVYGGEIE